MTINLPTTCVLLALGPITAWGQETLAPAATANVLQEVVVTAQFRSEDIQKAAIPIEAVSSADIQRANVYSPEQLTTLVPAVQISQSGGGEQALFIRGVGTETGNSYSDPGVAFNVDGIYIGRPSAMHDVFYDLERVEVLIGPQGTLYGRNATGGAVNVIPALPKIGELGGYASASYGNYDADHVEAAINLPIDPMLAARFSATQTRHDGYLSDGTNDANSYAARAQLLFSPSDQLSLRLSGDFAHDGGKGDGSTLAGYVNALTGQVVANPVRRSVGVEDPQTNAIFQNLYTFFSGRYGQATTVAPFTNNDYSGVKLELHADVGIGTLTTLASYRWSNLHSLDFGFGFPAYTLEHNHQKSLEVRLASRDEGLVRWLIGGYYYNEGIASNYDFNEYAADSFQQLDTGTRSEAGFARLTLSPTDPLRFIGGIRYTSEQKYMDGASNTFINVCTKPAFPVPACPGTPFPGFYTTPAQYIAGMGLIQVAPGPSPGYIQPSAAAANSFFLDSAAQVNNSVTTNRTTFRLAAEYDVAPGSLLYASFENGFHAGGFTFSQLYPTYRPESLDAWTVGSKNRFLNGTLQVNGELFLWKYKNQQISHFTEDPSGVQDFTTNNIGDSTNKGFDLAVSYKPLLNTLLKLDTQYLEATYNSFEYVAPTSPQQVITGCPTTPSGTNLVTVNCSGRTALHSPRWTINAGLEQRFPVGMYQITFAVDTHYQSSNIVGIEMLPGISEQVAYSMTNLSLDFGSGADKWRVGLFVNNIEDRLVIGQNFFNEAFQSYGSSPMPPRLYGIRANYVW